MNYRNFYTNNWMDDTMLSMSPEQKLLFVYLHTSPFSSACGIFKLQPKMMGFQLGFISTPFESSLKGLVGAFPNHVAVDWNTGEVALLQYPRQLLITASNRAMNAVVKDISAVQSIELLKALIAQNSPSVSAPYRSRMNTLLMERVNHNKVKTTTVITAVADDELPQSEPTQEGDPEPAATPVPIPTTWEPAADHYIDLITRNPEKLLYNLLGKPKKLPENWEDAVRARMRHYLADSLPYMLIIPTDPGERQKRESQMCIKIATWIESPYNKKTSTNYQQQSDQPKVATGVKIAEYSPKR